MDSFARHCNGQMIPLNSSLSYFSVIPLEDSELQRLIYDPASATPPAVSKVLPELRIVIVGYLENPPTKEGGSPVVSFRPPAQRRRRLSATVSKEDEVFLFLAIKDEDVADSHEVLYRELAELIADRSKQVNDRFFELILEELKQETRGEVDDRGWKLKEQLIRRQSDPTKNTKLLRNYARQALVDTLSLYLHGLCCDIDVDSGPRQLASRHVKRRLELLREILPPPAGVALFPEELQQPG